MAFDLRSASLADLVVDLLSALLYHSEVEGLYFYDFEIDASVEANTATVKAGGMEAASVELSGPPIKAVTYHRLKIEETRDGWHARVFFDV